MRDRQEIEGYHTDLFKAGVVSTRVEALNLEVLLDIRDLLISLTTDVSHGPAEVLALKIQVCE